MKDVRRPDRQAIASSVRDPLANPATVAAARQRSMSERLELALSWNAVASELRAGVASSRPPARP